MDSLSTSPRDSEDEILGYQVSDDALEIAAASARDGTGSLTVAFCTGLDTCPA
jgi:hypothetical protein